MDASPALYHLEIRKGLKKNRKFIPFCHDKADVYGLSMLFVIGHYSFAYFWLLPQLMLH